MARTIPPEIATALALAAASAFILPFYSLGPHATHMALHIATMNIVAPVIASLWLGRLPLFTDSPRLLWAASGAQLVLLWAWHAPPAQAAAMHSHALYLLMHATLFAAALWFWACVVGLSGRSRWHAIPALLITGKLVCLLAALMIFAPRFLYEMPHAHHASLDDQQLAGLLMITACPLSYVVAGVLIVTRLLLDLDRGVAPRRATAR